MHQNRPGMKLRSSLASSPPAGEYWLCAKFSARVTRRFSRSKANTCKTWLQGRTFPLHSTFPHFTLSSFFSLQVYPSQNSPTHLKVCRCLCILTWDLIVGSLVGWTVDLFVDWLDGWMVLRLIYLVWPSVILSDSLVLFSTVSVLVLSHFLDSRGQFSTLPRLQFFLPTPPFALQCIPHCWMSDLPQSNLPVFLLVVEKTSQELPLVSNCSLSSADCLQVCSWLSIGPKSQWPRPPSRHQTPAPSGQPVIVPQYWTCCIVTVLWQEQEYMVRYSLGMIPNSWKDRFERRK